MAYKTWLICDDQPEAQLLLFRAVRACSKGRDDCVCLLTDTSTLETSKGKPLLKAISAGEMENSTVWTSASKADFANKVRQVCGDKDVIVLLDIKLSEDIQTPESFGKRDEVQDTWRWFLTRQKGNSVISVYSAVAPTWEKICELLDGMAEEVRERIYPARRSMTRGSEIMKESAGIIVQEAEETWNRLYPASALHRLWRRTDGWFGRDPEMRHNVDIMALSEPAYDAYKVKIAEAFGCALPSAWLSRAVMSKEKDGFMRASSTYAETLIRDRISRR